MTLTSLMQLGRIEKEIVLKDDIKIKVHTLSVAEQHRAFVNLPNDTENEVARFTSLQAALLTEATDEVNGVKVTREQAKEMYESMQANVLAHIFTEYSELASEQSKVLEELKKK